MAPRDLTCSLYVSFLDVPGGVPVPRVRSLVDHPLGQALLGLALPVGEHVVIGSAPLWAAGLRDQIADLDVVVSTPVWDRLAQVCPPRPTPSGRGQRICLQIEVLDRWLPGWDTARLLASAVVRDGIPQAPLDVVMRSKLQTRRAKDLADLARWAARRARD